MVSKRSFLLCFVFFLNQSPRAVPRPQAAHQNNRTRSNNLELPNCESFNDEFCQAHDQIHANAGVEKRRWQTPKPGHPGHQASFQDYHSLVGYADITYTDDSARTHADVCIVATHKHPQLVSLFYYFNNRKHSSNCERFDSNQKSPVSLSVQGSDGTRLTLPPVSFAWNVASLSERAGDYRSGQKGAIVDFVGWPHRDVEKECELLGKAGYLGAKLFPVNEHLMSNEPDDATGALNPWYYSFQPVSYQLESRFGSREHLMRLINTCRSKGVRVYIDVVLNHFTGAGHDCLEHRKYSNECITWGRMTSSAALNRQSPFYTHSDTYKLSSNTGEPPSNEFPGAAIGPEDFHCHRELNTFTDLFTLNNGWMVGLTDVDTSRESVRERQAAFLVDLLSIGVSGFRIDAAKHISPGDLAAIFGKVKSKMGGRFSDDFFMWLEALSGYEMNLIYDEPGWYGKVFTNLLLKELKEESDLARIKFNDGSYPLFENPYIAPERLVIQNDNHDLQSTSFGVSLKPRGSVLVRDKDVEQHRQQQVKLFRDPYWVRDNWNDWPVRVVMSSFWFTYGEFGVPDGRSVCNVKTDKKCRQSVPRLSAYEANACAYEGRGYTRVHRDIGIINAMRSWIGLDRINASVLGLSHCNE
jgi:alpha-amylase